MPSDFIVQTGRRESRTNTQPLSHLTMLNSFVKERLNIIWLACLLVASPCLGFTNSRQTRTSPRLWALQARVGFVGCGTIATAIATGLANQASFSVETIAVSRRSEHNSAALYSAFPSLVSVHDDNQEILNKSDVIFVCVLPQQTSQVLQNLKFDATRHTLVSLVATAKLDDLRRDSQLGGSQVSKLICLPSIARNEGVALHCCTTPNESLSKLLQACSRVVTLKNEAEMEAAMVSGCLMGPLYGALKEGRDWLLEQSTTMTKQEASYLMIQQFMGMLQDADCESEDNPDRLDELIAEQTPGGLNEQALGNLDQLGGFKLQRQVMDAILSRIRGQSDGSI